MHGLHFVRVHPAVLLVIKDHSPRHLVDPLFGKGTEHTPYFTVELFHPALGSYGVHIISVSGIIEGDIARSFSVAEDHAQKVIKKPLLLHRGFFYVVIEKLLVEALPQCVKLRGANVRFGSEVLGGDDILNLGL